jgi:hypothetical protein
MVDNIEIYSEVTLTYLKLHDQLCLQIMKNMQLLAV